MRSCKSVPSVSHSSLPCYKPQLPRDRHSQLMWFSLASMKTSSNMFDIAVEPAFDFLSREYAELFDRSAATAFQHPFWLHSLYTRLAPHAQASPLVVVARHRTTGALAMVLPLLRIRRGPIRTV